MKRRSFIVRVSLFALSLTSTVVVAACSSSQGSSNNSDVKELKFGIVSMESQANQ